MKRIFFRINLKLAVLSLMGIWLSSCKTVYYPTTNNSPMLNNKGEFQASGIIGTGNFELQTAYAITDNIGVMLNGSYFNGTREIEINNEKSEIKEIHNLIEAGAGYFNTFGRLGKLEIFAGGGVGKVPANFRGIDHFYDGTQTSRMTKLFIQPSVGLGTDFVDFSGGIRISTVNISRAMRLFAEPELTVKLGYKSVRLVASIGLALPMNNINTWSDELLSWDFNPVIIGFGVQLNLGRKYEKR